MTTKPETTRDPETTVDLAEQEDDVQGFHEPTNGMRIWGTTIYESRPAPHEPTNGLSFGGLLRPIG